MDTNPILPVMNTQTKINTNGYTLVEETVEEPVDFLRTQFYLFE